MSKTDENVHKKDLITIEDLANKLKISKAHIRLMILKRRIPYYKIGRLIRFRELEIDNWINTGKREVANEY